MDMGREGEEKWTQEVTMGLIYPKAHTAWEVILQWWSMGRGKLRLVAVLQVEWKQVLYTWAVQGCQIVLIGLQHLLVVHWVERLWYGWQ